MLEAITTQLIFPFPGCEMNSSSEPTLIELSIARAYGKLTGIPDDRSAAVISVTRIGNYEIRMFHPPEIRHGVLFWLELLDLNTGTSIDSVQCHEIRDAVPAFEDLMSQADYLNSFDPGGAGA